MANKYLARDDAPFGDSLWEKIDGTMTGAAKSQLTGRRILPVKGPYGLGLKVAPLQDMEVKDGVSISQVLPILYVMKEFTLDVRDVAGFEREKIDLDLSPVAKAAIWCAEKEDDIVFNGSKSSTGLLNTKGVNKTKLSPWEDVGYAVNDIIKAVTLLDNAGFHGPFTMALAPQRYNLLFRRYPQGGGTELEHLKTVVAGGIYKAPILKDGGVVLNSGADFASIILGQDMQVGFIGPAGKDMEFTISESLALKIMAPASICVLE